MTGGTARARATEETRNRILDVARELLGQDPDAGMGEVAAAAGVVRRTVYGHFPARSDLVRTLAERAVAEIGAVLEEAEVDPSPVDAVWARFVARVWPLTHRYRVLLALRRGEQGDEIHALLGSVDQKVAALVRRGQDDGTFGDHLPALDLGRLAYSTVFTLADDHRAGSTASLAAATTTTLLLLGVPAGRARELAEAPGA